MLWMCNTNWLNANWCVDLVLVKGSWLDPAITGYVHSVYCAFIDVYVYITCTSKCGKLLINKHLPASRG